MNVQTRSHRYLSSRETILATSREAFLRHGFTDASMDAIAQRSGVSKTTLYAHFESKEALFNQVVVDAVTEHGDEAAALLDLPPSGPGVDGFRDRLAAVSGRILAMLMAPAAVALARLCVIEGTRMPRLSYEALGTARSSLLAALARFFQEQAPVSGLVIADTHEAADLFVLLTVRNFQHEAMLPWSAISTPEAHQGNAAHVADLMLRLYGKSGA